MRHPMRNTMVGLISALLVGACAAPAGRVSPAESQVLFVCEHGNVKSLMAASYFNRLASQRGVPDRAITRGTAPDSTTVPPAIVAQLRDEGFDVAGFHPVAVGVAEGGEEFADQIKGWYVRDVGNLLSALRNTGRLEAASRLEASIASDMQSRGHSELAARIGERAAL